MHLTPAPKVHREIALRPAVLERYVGVYKLPGMTVTITRTPEGLMAQGGGQPAERIYAETETEFFLKVVDAQITFRYGSSRGVTGLVLHQGGFDTPAKKIR